MTYQKALRLLEEGKRSCIYRKAWHKADPTAGVTWHVEGLTGRGGLFFSACGPWVYKTGGWGGTQEDHEADDWAGTMPEME